MTDKTLIRWIDGEAPAEISGGTTWGMPFARGTVTDSNRLLVRDAEGNATASQAWPLATWPDGSLKWAGIAFPATDAPSPAYEVTADCGAPPREGGLPPSGAPIVTVTETAAALTVDTGTLQMVIDRSGSHLFTTLTRGGADVARNARLVSLLQDNVTEGAGTASREAFTGDVTTVVLEQDGPVRAVVRLEGHHRPDAAGSGKQSWLPFVVRFYFYANARSVRMVHSFIWDGDAEQGLPGRARRPVQRPAGG
jgi:hypothetical protein